MIINLSKQLRKEVEPAADPQFGLARTEADDFDTATCLRGWFCQNTKALLLPYVACSVICKH